MAIALAAASIGGLGLAAAPATAAPGAITKLAIPSDDISHPSSLALSPSGATLYVGSFDDGITIVPTRRPANATLTGSTGISGLAVSPSGAELFGTIEMNGTVFAAGLASDGTLPGSLGEFPQVFNDPYGIASNRAGSQLLVSSWNGGVQALDPDSGTVLGTVTDAHGYLQHNPVAVAFAPSGRAAYVGSADGVVVISISGSATNPSYTATKLMTDATVGGGTDDGLAVSPDGRILYVSDTDTTSGPTPVLALSIATGRIVNRFLGINSPTGIAVTHDGATLYVASFIGSSVSALSLRTLTGRPSLVGRARVGRVLRVRAAVSTLGSVRVKLSYQWLANGHPIKHATTSSLKPTGADRHKQISVRVTGTAPGLITMTLTSAQTAKVS